MFKVGDKVRMLSDDRTTTMKNGEVGIVTSRSTYGCLQIQGFGSEPFAESRFELVQEEQVKFKVGDKVRCLLTSGHFVESYKRGAIYTITHITNDNIIRTVDEDGRTNGWIARNFELAEEAKSELQKLVDKANVGLQALHRLYHHHKSEIEMNDYNGNMNTIRDDNHILGKDQVVRYVRIKPKPKFEPYTIKSTGWNVDLEGNSGNIKIGCRSFHITTLKSALESLLNNHIFDGPVMELSLAASRKGVHEGQHILPWADVEELNEKLKKVGI